MIKNLLLEGFELKRRGYYKHAIEVFYKVLEKDNTSLELLLEIADLYCLLHNEERALSCIEQILDKNPVHINALKLLKKIFIDRKAFEQAEQTAKNIYCISKNDEDLAEILKLLNMQNKFDEVFEYKCGGDNPAVLLEEARAYYFKNDLEKAEEVLNKIIETAPDNQEALLLLGRVLFGLNKKEDCALLLDKLMINENNPDILDFVSQVEMYRGNLKKAAELAKAAVKVSKMNDRYCCNLANIFFKLGDTVSAKKYYNLAISLNPECAGYHFALARFYYSQKYYRKALEELKGDTFEIKLLRAVILYEAGYLALAEKELSVLKKAEPDNKTIAEYLGKIKEALRPN